MSDTIQNDEIDLIELIGVLWSGKWFIAIVTGLVSVASLFGLMAIPTVYEMRMTIRPLSPQQMNAYAPLNNVPGISAPIYAGENLIGYKGVITSEGLYNAVIDDIISGDSMRAAISELDPEFGNFEGTAEEKSEALIIAARKFERKNRKGTKIFELVTTSTDRQLVRDIFQKFASTSALAIRRENLISVSNLKISIENALEYEIETLEQEIDNQRLSYLDTVKRRKAHLAEQAKIARSLGLEKPLDVTQINNSISSNNEGVETDELSEELFRRGYKALEAELSLLKKRPADSWALYMSGYPEKAARLRQLQNDKRLERIEGGMALTPLADAENFRPAAFDLENIIVTPATNKLLILILISLLTGIAATIFILFRHYARQRVGDPA